MRHFHWAHRLKVGGFICLPHGAADLFREFIFGEITAYARCVFTMHGLRVDSLSPCGALKLLGSSLLWSLEGGSPEGGYAPAGSFFERNFFDFNNKFGILSVGDMGLNSDDL